MKPLSKKSLWLTAALFVLLLAAECVLSNLTALNTLGKEPEELSLADASVSGNLVRDELTGTIQITSTGTLTFRSLSRSVSSVSVRLSGEELQPGTLVVSLKDEAASESYKVYLTGRFYTQGVSYFRIRSSGDCGTLRLQWDTDTPCTLEAVVLNDAPPFSFNALRFLLAFAACCGLILLREKQYWRKLYDYRDGATAWAPTFLLLTLTALFLLLTVCNLGVIRMPLVSGKSYDAYAQLFSSLLQGKTDLDIPADVGKLQALENPYDVTQRTSAHADFDAIWDRAFYDGKFYCYFGIAPIFAVYFPVYALSFGKIIPTSGLASLILLVFALFGIFAALNALAKTFGIRPPAVLFWLSVPACALCFLLPMLGSSSDMYYLPVSSAYCFFSWTLAFGFGAFLRERPAVRRLFLFLSGFFLAMTVASRPPVAVYAALLLPVFVSWIRKEKKTWWKEAVSFALPLLAGVGLLFWYNAVRFGSPLEFGARYQMTVHDIRSAGLDINLLGESVVHYFLQMPSFSGMFPYLGPGHLDLASYGVYFYSARSIGVFHLPVALVPFAHPLTKKKDPVRTAVFLIAVLLPFVLAFLDLCMAGSCIRYISDIVFPLSLSGILLLWEWGESIAGCSSSRTGFRLFLLPMACLVLSCCVGFALTFSNERSWILTSNTAFFRSVEEFFSAR